MIHKNKIIFQKIYTFCGIKEKIALTDAFPEECEEIEKNEEEHVCPICVLNTIFLEGGEIMYGNDARQFLYKKVENDPVNVRTLNYFDQIELDQKLSNLYKTILETSFSTTNLDDMQTHFNSEFHKCPENEEFNPLHKAEFFEFIYEPQAAFFLNNFGLKGILNICLADMKVINLYGDHYRTLYVRKRGTNEPNQLKAYRAIICLDRFLSKANQLDWSGKDTFFSVIFSGIQYPIFFEALRNIARGNWKIHSFFDIQTFYEYRKSEDLCRIKETVPLSDSEIGSIPEIDLSDTESDISDNEMDIDPEPQPEVSLPEFSRPEYDYEKKLHTLHNEIFLCD